MCTLWSNLVYSSSDDPFIEYKVTITVLYGTVEWKLVEATGSLDDQYYWTG